MASPTDRPVGFEILPALLEEVQKLRFERGEDRALLERLERRLAPQLSTVKQAAEAWNVCATTVQRWCKSGKVPCVKKGRSWMIDLAAVRPPTSDEVAAAAAEARGPR